MNEGDAGEVVFDDDKNNIESVEPRESIGTGEIYEAPFEAFR